jgi:hypothetical protein
MERFTSSGILLVLCAASVQAQVKLEWKFKENDRFEQETITNLKQTMTPAKGQATTQDFEHVTQASFAVKKVNADGSVVLEQRLDKIKATNRAAPGSPEVSGLIKKLEDAVFIVTLNPKREVTQFDGYEELIKRVAGDDPTAAKAVREIVKPETLRRSVEEAFGFLPDKPLNKGDKWERKMEVSLGPLGAILATHTYTYDGPEMKDAKTLQKISVTSALSYNPPKGETGGFPFQITKGELKAESAQGTLLFDADAGRLVASEMKLKLKGSVTVAVMNQSHDLAIEQEQAVNIRVIPR